MQHLILSLYIVLASNLLDAQSSVGLKVNAGLSTIDARLKSSISSTKQYFYLRPSYQAGIFYNLNFKEKFSFGTEIQFNYIQGREREEIPYIDNQGNTTNEFIVDIIDRRISYLSFPVYFGIKLDKFDFNLGLQGSVTLDSYGQEKGQVPQSGGGQTWNNSGKLGIDEYDFGARAGIFYNIFPRFAIEANYYYGLNNLLKNQVIIPNWKWKIRQATLGFRYSFYKFKKKVKIK